jgi:hypothetical protein
MAYFAIAPGLLCFFFGATSKNPPIKRPSLIELQPRVNRVIYVWMGLVMTGLGAFLAVEAHRR